MKFSRLSFLSVVLFLTSFFVQSQTQILVIDQNSDPVSDAIISLSGVNGHTSKQVAIMDQVDKQFSPQVLAISQGQSVHFPNSDNIRHHVYSFSATKPFEIKLYKGAPSSPIAFDKPGIVVLGCNIHDGMVGYIYVSAGDAVAKSNGLGIATFVQDKLPDTVEVWHSALSAAATEKKTVELSEKNQAGQWVVRLTLKQKAEKKKTKSFGDIKARFN